MKGIVFGLVVSWRYDSTIRIELQMLETGWHYD
jgi:hypothetical protein